MEDNYLLSATKQFEYYRMLGKKTIDRLTEEELFMQIDGHNNSIMIIVNHLHGNMMSRWTDFLNSDGEKDFRNRDREFESNIKSKEELLLKWDEGWNCLFDALASVNKSNFDQVVYIRNQGHSITEAINRQLCHYAYHIGQIVFIGKVIKKENWESLSIPKGGSKEYNAEKFSKEKHKGHFTDEYLNP